MMGPSLIKIRKKREMIPVNETLGRIQMLISPSPIGSDPVAMDA